MKVAGADVIALVMDVYAALSGMGPIGSRSIVALCLDTALQVISHVLCMVPACCVISSVRDGLGALVNVGVGNIMRHMPISFAHECVKFQKKMTRNGHSDGLVMTLVLSPKEQC